MLELDSHSCVALVLLSVSFQEGSCILIFEIAFSSELSRRTEKQYLRVTVSSKEVNLCCSSEENVGWNTPVAMFSPLETSYEDLCKSYGARRCLMVFVKMTTNRGYGRKS